MFDLVLGVAGTPDLIGELRKLKKVAGVWNIDVKRSLYAGPAIGLQTAATPRSTTARRRAMRAPRAAARSS
jgi:hypothetical protein